MTAFFCRLLYIAITIDLLRNTFAQMNIKILSVGRVKDPDLRNKISDYTGRISRDARIAFQEIKDSDAETEGRRLIDIIDKEAGYVFALAEEGALYTSAKFAARIRAIHKKLIFVIGGPLGLSPAVKSRADEILSLSRMTFSHEMAQLFLLEQLYRGISINLNRKYHKA
jgi:23S rRNA (pseudouridine1915-N3)-methyltransferase